MTSPIKAADRFRYGFKRISPDNLLEHDDDPSYPSRLRKAKWVQACLKPQLEPSVPDEIFFLFEAARGTMVYGMFFLPVATLAAEQCFRVLEAAARQRCKQLGLLKKKPGKEKLLPDVFFAEVLAKLRQAGKIHDSDIAAWETMPFLRNSASHPKSQSIWSRDTAAGQLAYTSELLNRLFK